MSPEAKRRLTFLSATLSALALIFLALSYVPTFFYIFFFLVGPCAVCYYKARDFQLFDRLGLNPRRVLSAQPTLLRLFSGSALRGGRANTRTPKSYARGGLAAPSGRYSASFTNRRDATFSEPEFSPRDILMGSYMAKADSPTGAGRPVAAQGRAREQLRERLVRPNHGATTPNRRLSFGASVGAAGFNITPKKHYPLQQGSTISVGLLPPAPWDGFSKKHILTRRNAGVHSPVTVKIAKPDTPTRSPFFDQLNSPGAVTSPGFGVPPDPCSRETVLSALRKSQKHGLDNEEESHVDEQKSKRRRRNSSGSSHSAFEPLLANGAPSQLVPKPGSLKRGTNVSLEETTVKRSRTSSFSSVSGGPASYGVPGSVRNPINSSYSSSRGYLQKRVASSQSMSPFTSPVSSPCQTPKRIRLEDTISPTSVSPKTSDKTAADQVPGSEKLTPKAEAPVTSPSDSGGSSGNIRRKVQLVPLRRNDQIAWPSPPQLGYTVTAKDLDMEKKAALRKIQKALEEPEPEKPTTTPASTSSGGLFSLSQPFTAATSVAVSTPSLASILTSPGSSTPASTAASSIAPAPTIDLTVTQASTSSVVLTQIATPTASTTSTSAVTVPNLSNPQGASLKNMASSSLLGIPSSLAASLAAPQKPASAPNQTTAPASTGGLFSQLSKPFTAAASTVTSTPSLASLFTNAGSSTPASTAASASGPAPTIDLTVPPANTSSAAPALTATPTAASTASAFTVPNPLSGSLKNMNSSVFGTPSSLTATFPAPAAPQAPVSTGVQIGTLKAEPASVTTQPSLTTPGATGLQPATSMPSAFAQILAQPLQPSSSTPDLKKGSLFSLMSTATPAPVTLTSTASNASATTTGLASSAAMLTQSGFKPIFAPGATEVKQTQPTFKPIFNSAFGQPAMSASSALVTQSSSSVFGGLTNAQPAAAASAPSSTSTTQTPNQSLFGNWGSTSTAAAPAPSNNMFQFGAQSSAPAASSLSTSTTTSNSTGTTFQFGATKPAQAHAANPPSVFAFGQPATTQNSTPSIFGGFGMASNTSSTTANAPTTQATFGSSSFSASMSFPNTASQAPTEAKPFAFGSNNSGGNVPAPFSFGAPASTAAPTFGTSGQPAFGAPSGSFSFSNTTTQSAAPTFGPTHTAAPIPAPTFTFGATPGTPQNSAQNAPAPAPAPAPGGFNFTASLSGAQFGTPAPASQNAGFTFGAGNTDNKPIFGTSTPSFGASSGHMPFGSPATPVQGFSASPFGTPAAASFSIGAGSKPSGTRQRLQARRQHVRKK